VRIAKLDDEAAEAVGSTRGCDYDGQRNNGPTSADFVAIACGDSHSVGLRDDGTVVTWGDNDAPASAGFVAIACGVSHSVALHHDGSVVTWDSKFRANARTLRFRGLRHDCVRLASQRGATAAACKEASSRRPPFFATTRPTATTKNTAEAHAATHVCSLSFRRSPGRTLGS